MYKLFFLFLLALSLHSVDIAITIDDHPAVKVGNEPLPMSTIFDPQERTDALICALSKYKCSAAFFCIGKYCIEQNDPHLLSCLTQNGHFIGNHTFNHQHYSSMKTKQLETEVKYAEAILKPYEMQPWFRYPYLDYGNRKELGGSMWKAIKGYRLLNKLGYKEGFVTINTFDWRLNAWLVDAVLQKREINYEALKALYIKLVKEWCFFNINYYNSIGFSDITHTLCLYANDLNALFLEDVLAMIKHEGWNLVSPKQAFENAKWRKLFAKTTRGKQVSPPSLNIEKIDRQIKELNIFS